MIKIQRNDVDEGYINKLFIHDITRNGNNVYIGTVHFDVDGDQIEYKEEYGTIKEAENRVKDLLIKLECK